MKTYLIIIVIMSSITLACSDSTIISKNDWGGVAGDSTLMKNHKIEHITIHHAGVIDDGSKSGVQKMKDLQTFSLEEKGWGDVPYHFVIDLQGRLYEGRDVKYAGDTNTNYDPTGHLLICVNGNYEEQQVTSESYETLVHFTAKMAETYSIPVEKIKTHRDYATDTVCPGRNLYAYFQSGVFLRDVKVLLGK
jgi:N-acetyl-anhydromuramyl-L-alanine amidase AmpD